MGYMEDYEDYIELDTISYAIYEETVKTVLENSQEARRNIVKNYPELNANIDIRMEEEQKYIEFAREN